MNEKATETIFDAVLQLNSAAKRKAYLDMACGDDTELRHKIEGLLEAHERAEGFYANAGVELHTMGSGNSEATLIASPLSEGPGAVIGRYKLLQKVGEGGMGVVYMAEQTEPVTRKVALKIIKLGMDTKQVVARFEAERQALAMMDHPNIAKVLDAGATDTGRPYFVMELVRGVPIAEYCDKNKLSTQDRLNLFVPVCQAIQHAHQKGVIHRDIKPSNVMVTLHDGNAVPKVIDFGIAKATNQKLTEKTLFTNYAQMIGTPAYMSPEQAEMSGLDVDTRTDVYSLGVLLYELLTGTTPFPSNELLSMGYGQMQKVIAEKEPPKPSTRLNTMQHEERTVVAKNRSMEASALGKVFQGDLDWIVMKALEKDRTRRYETVNGLVVDIRRHLDNEPVSAAAPTFRYQLTKFARRNRKYMRVAAVVAALLIAAVLFSSIQALRATRARNAADLATNEARKNYDEARRLQESETKLREQAVTRAEELSENNYFQSVALAYQEVSASRPAHALQLLEECPVDLRDWEWNHVRHRSIAGDQPVIHLGEPVYDLTVSPNGRNVALIVGETLRLAELTPEGDLMPAQTLGPVTRPILGFERWISFSPDSRFLATAGNGGMVTIWNVAKRTPIPFQASSNRIDAIAYHPSGNEIAVVSSVTFGSSQGTIGLLEVPSGRVKKQIQSGTVVFSIAYSPDWRWLAAGMVDPISPHFVRILDASSGEQVSDLREHLLPVLTLAFSADSRWLVSGGDTTVKLWDVSTWRLEQPLSGHSMSVKSVGFTQDGRRVISAGEDREVKIWDPFKAREILSLNGHRDEIPAMAMTSRGFLISGDASGDLRIWDASPPVVHKPLFTLSGHTNRIGALTFHPDHPERLYSVAENDGIVWDANTGQRLDQFPAIFDLTISRDGLHIVHPVSLVPDEESWRVSESAGIALEVNDAYEVAISLTEANPDNKMYLCADISVDSEWLAGGTTDGEVHVWKRGTGTPLRKLLGHHAILTSVRFSPDGHYLVSLSRDGEMLRWDVPRLTESQQAFQLLPPNATRYAHFGFSPDGKRLATGDGFSGVLVLEVETRKTLRSIPNAHSGIVAVARFSLDGRWIASGGSDHVVRLWDAATGDLKETLIGHTAMVNDVAFSPDRKRLASAGWDQTILVWELDLP
jgi:eukaryotic-like serine/threonine-protein kinase